MTKQLSRGLRAGFVVAVTGAAVVGGAASAVVMAAIPSSSDGQIHACYRNNASLTDAKGALRVIDSDANQTCTAQETGLNWPAQQNSSGAPTLKDGNGQVLGTAMDLKPYLILGYGNDGVRVYNATLKRVIHIWYDSNAQQLYVAPDANAVFQSTGCTGQAYTFSQPESNTKTFLYRWGSGVSATYGIVADTASPSTLTVNSTMSSGSCSPLDGESQTVYALNPVTLPFSTPLTTPFKF